MNHAPAFLVEWYVVFAAVQNDLVAAHDLCNLFQRVDDPQSQFSPLHRFCYCNVLDVANDTATMRELALKKDCSDTNNLIRRLLYDDNGEVSVATGFQLIEDVCRQSRVLTVNPLVYASAESLGESVRTERSPK